MEVIGFRVAKVGKVVPSFGNWEPGGVWVAEPTGAGGGVPEDVLAVWVGSHFKVQNGEEWKPEFTLQAVPRGFAVL